MAEQEGAIPLDEVAVDPAIPLDEIFDESRIPLDEVFESAVARGLQQVHLSLKVVKKGQEGQIRKAIGKSMARNIKALGACWFDELMLILKAPVMHPLVERYAMVREICETAVSWSEANRTRIIKARKCTDKPILELLQHVCNWITVVHRVMHVWTHELTRDLLVEQYFSDWDSNRRKWYACA